MTTRDSAFIFDLDGTLFDSAPQIYGALAATFERLSLESISFNEASKLIGLPAEELFSHVELNSSELGEAVSLFRSNLESEILNSNVVFPMTPALLRRISELGFSIGVATSKPSHLANMVIKNSELGAYVNFVQGTDGFLPKPHPEVVFRCLSKLHVDKGFMVGDRKEDILAGNSAGLLSVGVAQSHISEEELADAGAFATFESIVALNGSLEELLLKADLGSGN